MGARRLLVLALVALAAATLPGCSRSSQPPGRATGTGSALRDLHNVSELKARFNADIGSTRLILLLSPT